MDFLGPLITSKTPYKLLLRFILNQNLICYLHGLSKELDENTNSVRVELNRLEAAILLRFELKGRRKLYYVNTSYPLTSDLISIVPKVFGIYALVGRVVDNLPGLRQVWVCGVLALGVESNTIQTLTVGDGLNRTYIKGGLAVKCKSLLIGMGKTVLEMTARLQAAPYRVNEIVL